MITRYKIVDKIAPKTPVVVRHFRCEEHFEDTSPFSTITCHLGSGNGNQQDIQFYYGAELADDLAEVQRNTSEGQWSAILFPNPSITCTVSKPKVIFEQIN